MPVFNQKNLIFTTHAGEMAEICKPLQEYFGITNFVYQRNFTNGEEIRLSNNPAWLLHFYEQEFYKFSAFEKHPSELMAGFILWSHLQNHHRVLQAAREFNIDHGITLVKKIYDGCEYYFFGTTRDNHSIVNFYLNNLDLLEKFILYFKDRGQKIIAKALEKKIILPNKYQQTATITDKGNVCLLKDNFRKEFLNAIPIKQFKLNDRYNTMISKREYDCIVELRKGGTLKEISKKLTISPRTVETYVNSLKVKLNCKTKSELISKLNEIDLR